MAPTNDKTTQDVAIGILPYGMKPRRNLASLPTSGLRWPLGCPARLVGKTLADMETTDHLVCYAAEPVWFSSRPGFRARLSVVIAEPRALHMRHMRFAIFFGWRVWRVFTCDKRLLRWIRNGVFFPSATSWVANWDDLDLTKTKLLSIIASKKKAIKGQKLRHVIVDWVRENGIDTDVMGRGYRPIQEKSEGLAKYRYSLVIENVQEPSYFTEKIIDALLCRTVPIYWGAPDIGSYFDIDGIVVCQSEAEIKAAIRMMSEEDYNKRLPAIERNRERARGWADAKVRVAKAILAESSEPKN